MGHPGVRVQGSVGVYDVDSRWGWPLPIELDRQPDTPLRQLTMQDGIPLYGQEESSFPPIEALCLYGGPTIGEWLSSLGLDRTDYDHARALEMGEAYQEVYRRLVTGEVSTK